MPSFTRGAIKQSFLKMLNEKPLNQITVKAIVDDCGINRNTFYYHYDDIPSLFREIVKESAERLIAEHRQAQSLEECLAAAIRLTTEHKRAVLHAYRSENRDLFAQQLAKICHDLVVSYLKMTFGDMAIPREDWDVLVRFYQCELFGQIMLWLESNMCYDIQAQFARLCRLRRGVARQVIQRCIDEAAGR